MRFIKLRLTRYLQVIVFVGYDSNIVLLKLFGYSREWTIKKENTYARH